MKKLLLIKYKIFIIDLAYTIAFDVISFFFLFTHLKLHLKCIKISQNLQLHILFIRTIFLHNFHGASAKQREECIPRSNTIRFEIHSYNYFLLSLILFFVFWKFHLKCIETIQNVTLYSIYTCYFLHNSH